MIGFKITKKKQKMEAQKIMKSTKLHLIVGLIFLVLTSCNPKGGIEVSSDENSGNFSEQHINWKEEHAYTLGVQAYLYLYPWLYLPEIRYEWIGEDMALNQFHSNKTLVDASYRNGGSPNNDTQYSIAFLDLRNGPVVVSHPDLGERYFTFEIASMTSDNFAYIGTRTTGNKAGDFLIAGPGWDGKIPNGLKLPTQSKGTKAMGLPAISPTPFALLIGRTAVKDLGELEKVNALIDTYSIQPLANWLKDEPFIAKDKNVWKPFDRNSDPLADWKTINKALEENPPLEQNRSIILLFKTIGIGPGIDVTKQDSLILKGLARAANDGRVFVNKAIQGGAFGTTINGWSFPKNTIGSAGYLDDLFTRAMQCLGGIIANDPEEAMYPNTFFDSEGNFLDGSNNYTITFQEDNLPQVSQFWSLTLYDETFNYTDNPLNKYNISSLRDKFSVSDDGTITFYIQHESPGEDKESNWLPAPASGKIFLILRAYGPGENLLNQTWKIPGIVKAD